MTELLNRIMAGWQDLPDELAEQVVRAIAYGTHNMGLGNPMDWLGHLSDEDHQTLMELRCDNT